MTAAPCRRAPQIARRGEQALGAQEEVGPWAPRAANEPNRASTARECDSRVENAKFDVPPSASIPAATAIASSRVDLPLPFSPIRYVTRGCSRQSAGQRLDHGQRPRVPGLSLLIIGPDQLDALRKRLLHGAEATGHRLTPHTGRSLYLCTSSHSAMDTAARSAISASRSPTAATSAASTACRRRACPGSSTPRSSRFEEIARLVRAARRDGRRRRPADRRRAAGAARFPAARAMLAASTDVHDLSLTTNGYLLERDADALVGAGVDRFNVSVDSLQRDRFFELTRRDALPQVLRGLRGARPQSRGAPDQDQRGRDPRLHRGGGAPVRRASRASSPTRSASSSSCRSTPIARWTRRGGAHGRGDPRRDRRGLPARARAARAERDRARLPLRRRQRPDRLHQPGVRAVLLGLQPHPPDRRRAAAHLPVLAQRDRPAGAAARRRRATPSSSRSSATPSGARSSSTTSASPGSSSRARTMSRHRRLTDAARRNALRSGRPLDQLMPSDVAPDGVRR